MAERQTIRVKIFGTEYVLKGDSDPAYMQELGAMVDKKMRELGQPGSVQVSRVAILTAFQFADEWMKARRLLEGERQKLDGAARLAAQLDLKIQEALKDGAAAADPASSLTMEEAEADADSGADTEGRMPGDPAGEPAED